MDSAFFFYGIFMFRNVLLLDFYKNFGRKSYFKCVFMYSSRID